MADLIAAWYDMNIEEFATGALLDLGAGKAPLYDAYAPFVDEVILADWENSMHKNIHLDVVCDITKKLPFKNKQFDTIIFSDVLEHVPNPAEVLGEINRITRPGGVVLINVPFLYWLHETPYDYYRYTEYMLKKLATDAGFNIEKMEVLGGGWAVFLDLTSKLMGKHPAMVKTIQRFGAKLLKGKLMAHPQFPLAYAAVLRKDTN